MLAHCWYGLVHRWQTVVRRHYTVVPASALVVHPELSWVSCLRPCSPGSRFMICCDRCEEWFHGDCVGISEARGRLLERNGEDYICPNCTILQVQDEPRTEAVGPQEAGLPPADPDGADCTSMGTVEQKSSEDQGIKGRIEKAANPSGKKKLKIFQPVGPASGCPGAGAAALFWGCSGRPRLAGVWGGGAPRARPAAPGDCPAQALRLGTRHVPQVDLLVRRSLLPCSRQTPGGVSPAGQGARAAPRPRGPAPSGQNWCLCTGLAGTPRVVVVVAAPAEWRPRGADDLGGQGAQAAVCGSCGVWLCQLLTAHPLLGCRPLWGCDPAFSSRGPRCPVRGAGGAGALQAPRVWPPAACSGQRVGRCRVEMRLCPCSSRGAGCSAGARAGASGRPSPQGALGPCGGGRAGEGTEIWVGRSVGDVV